MTRNTLHGLAFMAAIGGFLAFVCAGCFSNDPPVTVPAALALD